MWEGEGGALWLAGRRGCGHRGNLGIDVSLKDVRGEAGGGDRGHSVFPRAPASVAGTRLAFTQGTLQGPSEFVLLPPLLERKLS